MLRTRHLSWLLPVLLSGSAFGDIFEERNASGSNLFVPTAFPLNPAANSTNLTVVEVQQTKRDDKINFVVNPGNNNAAAVEEKMAKKDLALGGQYPLGGASFGLQYSEYRRAVTAKNANQNKENHELFVNRDYRITFGVDFTNELRGAFTFHYTALKSDLAGDFQINSNDRTHYNGTMSGYGLGLYYQLQNIGIGVFTHPPMRGKATVEGEQKIISEAGLYGAQGDFRVNPLLNLSFNVTRWSYKHDERDDPSTSPVDQRNIQLRGVDLNQFLRKTMAYGLAGEYAVTPMIFAKAGYLRQNAVFLFGGDHLPGDDKEAETMVRYSEYRIASALKSKDFIAEIGLHMNSAKQSTLKAKSGFGELGGYTSKASSVNLMIGAAF